MTKAEPEVLIIPFELAEQVWCFADEFLRQRFPEEEVRIVRSCFAWRLPSLQMMLQPGNEGRLDALNEAVSRWFDAHGPAILKAASAQADVRAWVRDTLLYEEKLL